MKGVRFFRLVLALCGLLVLPSCGGNGRGTDTAPQTGSLSLALTDQITDDYKAVYVTISEVQVHLTGDTWKVVAAPNKTYNLLDLINGVREELGISELDAGDYTQMRLIIGENPDGGINILSKQHLYANYVIDLDNEDHELKVPSGYQTGVKIVHGFTISPDQTTELILDFNASESVVVAGKTGKWLLKPTIKVLNTVEYSIISGTVDDGAGHFLSGVLVSAQISDPSAPDLTDRIVTESSTITDENGQYQVFLSPGTYNLVVCSTSYYPEVECSVPLASGQVAENHNFSLDSDPTGTVSGDVNIAGAEEDQYATISLRQSFDCDSDSIDDTKIEIKSLNVINSGSYSLSLPVGFYDAVASSYDKDTVIYEHVEVVQDKITEINIDM